MSDATFLFLVSALYLLFGAWVITRTGGSRVGVPVKAKKNDPKSFGNSFQRDHNRRDPDTLDRF